MLPLTVWTILYKYSDIQNLYKAKQKETSKPSDWALLQYVMAIFYIDLKTRFWVITQDSYKCDWVRGSLKFMVLH